MGVLNKKRRQVSTHYYHVEDKHTMKASRVILPVDRTQLPYWFGV